MSRPARSRAPVAQGDLWAESAPPVPVAVAAPVPVAVEPPRAVEPAPEAAPVAVEPVAVAAEPEQPRGFRWADVPTAMPPMPPKREGRFVWPHPLDPRPTTGGGQ